MPDQVVYNGYTITAIDGAYNWTHDGKTFSVSIDFAVQADDDFTALDTAIDTMYAALRVPDKDLVIQEGGVTVFPISTAQATNAYGFNCEPEVKRLTGENQTAGTFNKFTFSCRAVIPADYRGSADGLFQYGVENIQVAVRRPFSNLHEITFTGQWKAVSTNANAASTNYLANIQAIITAKYLGVYYAGLTWDVQTDDPVFDRNNKTMTFSIRYRQRAWTYTGDGGSKYILKALSVIESRSRTISQIPKFGDSSKKQGAIFESGSTGSGRTGTGGPRTQTTIKPGLEGITGYDKSYKAPIDYTIRGQVEIDITDLTEAQAVSKWNSEIRGWVLGLLKTAFGSKVTYWDKQEISYDVYNQTLNFSLQGVQIMSGTLFGLVVRFEETTQPNEIFEPMASGKPRKKIFYTTGEDLLFTVSVTAINVNGELDNATFLKFLPTEYNPKTGTGWRITHKKQSLNVESKAPIDQEVTINTKGFVYNMTYLQDSSIIKKSAVIQNSGARRA